MRVEGILGSVSIVFIIAPDKGLLDIRFLDIDIASCDRVVRSLDFTIVCSEGDVFL